MRIMLQSTSHHHPWSQCDVLRNENNSHEIHTKALNLSKFPSIISSSPSSSSQNEISVKFYMRKKPHKKSFYLNRKKMFSRIFAVSNYIKLISFHRIDKLDILSLSLYLETILTALKRAQHFVLTHQLQATHTHRTADEGKKKLKGNNCAAVAPKRWSWTLFIVVYKGKYNFFMSDEGNTDNDSDGGCEVEVILVV